MIVWFLSPDWTHSDTHGQQLMLIFSWGLSWGLAVATNENQHMVSPRVWDSHDTVTGLQERVFQGNQAGYARFLTTYPEKCKNSPSAFY